MLCPGRNLLSLASLGYIPQQHLNSPLASAATSPNTNCICHLLANQLYSASPCSNSSTLCTGSSTSSSLSRITPGAMIERGQLYWRVLEYTEPAADPKQSVALEQNSAAHLTRRKSCRCLDNFTCFGAWWQPFRTI